MSTQRIDEDEEIVHPDRPILVEKPTYSSNPATYGATNTLGYATGTF